MGGWKGNELYKRDGLSGEAITALYEDRSGRLWVGAYGENNGLRVLQGRHFVIPDGLENLGTVSAIFEDRQGALWLGTEDHLVKYSQGIRTVFTTKDGLAANDVRVISAGANGDLWMAGVGGLTQFHAGKLISYTERDGLPSNSVRALYEDSDGVLWIGTYDGGLGRFRDGKFTTYTTRAGLFSNGVFQILEDRRGNLWMSSNQGIYRVRKQELNEFAAGKRNAITSIAYGKSDGMLNLECNGNRSPAGIKARDGKLWFPTQDGAAVIDPEVVRTNPHPPPVMIESFLVDRHPVAIDRAVEMGPEPDTFEIQYTALSFIDSDRIQFKYKLGGLDPDWVDAGTRRTAYYSHVPPGKYLFQVIATNSDGVWNTEGRTLALTVLPPFYRTWWFAMLAFLSVAGLIYLAWRYRVGQLTRAHGTQQAFTRQLISSQESERKRIAAELHDSLGQHLVVISLNNGTADGTARCKMEEISAAASQALTEVREISYNLRPYQLDRIGLTRAIEAIVDKAAGATAIEFQAQVDEIDGIFAKEAEINFYRIIQECINNVVKHSQATLVSVTVRRTDGRLLLSICDNGKGFTPGAAGASNSSGGFGLIGVRERAQLLGGKPAIQSAPGQGTTISIEIPDCE